jgi:hypothetical protein
MTRGVRRDQAKRVQHRMVHVCPDLMAVVIVAIIVGIVVDVGVGSGGTEALCLPPPHCHHPHFDHCQKGISNDKGSVDEARDNSRTWEMASTPTHNNQMLKWEVGRQCDKKGWPT